MVKLSLCLKFRNLLSIGFEDCEVQEELRERERDTETKVIYESI